jgi:hypothetical protein
MRECPFFQQVERTFIAIIIVDKTAHYSPLNMDGAVVGSWATPSIRNASHIFHHPGRETVDLLWAV